MIKGNVLFDTCVYYQPGMDLLAETVPAENIIFGSEMIGAVRGIDPETGTYYDDTPRFVKTLDITDGDREKIFAVVKIGAVGDVGGGYIFLSRFCCCC